MTDLLTLSTLIQRRSPVATAPRRRPLEGLSATNGAQRGAFFYIVSGAQVQQTRKSCGGVVSAPVEPVMTRARCILIQQTRTH